MYKQLAFSCVLLVTSSIPRVPCRGESHTKTGTKGRGGQSNKSETRKKQQEKPRVKEQKTRGMRHSSDATRHAPCKLRQNPND
uniref:Putative secreted protein n=1 Tax=Ixodes ricinus TaxID=34613 RepID=A0A6B0TX34_IXORI